MPAWEDKAGIHYIKDQPVQRVETRPEVCGVCRSPATCVARLYVPASRLSMNPDAKDVSVLLTGPGMFWCDRHFYALKGPEMVAGERGQQIREAVAAAFRQRNAFPNFDKAVIGRIPTYDPDFARAQEAIQIARRN